MLFNAGNAGGRSVSVSVASSSSPSSFSTRGGETLSVIDGEGQIRSFSPDEEVFEVATPQEGNQLRKFVAITSTVGSSGRVNVRSLRDHPPLNPRLDDVYFTIR